MIILNPFLSLSLISLLLKSLSDLQHSRLIFSPHKQIISKTLSLSVVALYALCLVLSFTPLDGYQISLSFFLIAASVLALYKRRYKLYNSIEEIYEAILEISLIQFAFSPLSALPILALVLVSSVSAGLSKLNSDLWKYTGEGFIMFCTLPSVSRPIIRSTITSISSRFSPFRSLLLFIGLITPYIQILTPFLLVFIPTDSLYFKMSLLFQLCFGVMLFIISDLSWIPQLYISSILMFFYIKSHASLYLDRLNYSDLGYLSLSTAYFLASTSLMIFPNITTSLMPKSINTMLRHLCLDLVPFKMFTEAHMVNIITHYIDIESGTSSYLLNAFNQYGLRDSVQNLSSRHMQALMYPLGDLCIKAYSYLGASQSTPLTYDLQLLAKSRLHFIQLKALIGSNRHLSINFFQHVYCTSLSSYETRHLAHMVITRYGKSYKAFFSAMSPCLPFQGR